MIKSQLSVVVNTDAQIDEPEAASAMEVIDLPIKTEGKIEKKSAASDDFQVRQQRRKSKKSATEGDADTPLEELPPPIKKVHLKCFESHLYLLNNNILKAKAQVCVENSSNR